MSNGNTGWIAGFIWGIADDVLRDVYVRGHYRDVILPMTVIRRLDAVLEPTKQAVLNLNKKLDAAGVLNKDSALRSASGQSFYNASPYSLRDLLTRAKQQQLQQDFVTYLDGFSPNVQEILDKFEFRNQIKRLSEADILGSLIEKFTSREVNLSPNDVLDQDGNVRLAGLSNHGMGTVFEELLRRFNEENNEEAGEHFTPRDVIKLMAHLIFEPIAEDIRSAPYRVYDGACGTGGMLTDAEEALFEIAVANGNEVTIHLFGQEINPETYAIAKADLLLKGEGQAADNIKYGSTLSADAFTSMEFDFMLSNPPYGKSWKTDQERMGGKKDITDPRFIVQHKGEELSFITRSSDGQLMFLVNKLSKMVRVTDKTPIGSRIAEVHNGSSLFTGDAGQGESNIRRWIIENDWLEAIVALPLNMFYNTGIATYIWVLTNNKPKHRRGFVQLIDATNILTPLRKNLGKKNCELSPDQIELITKMVLDFEENEQSKVFQNEAFGYWKIVVERPLRLRVDLSKGRREEFRSECVDAKEEPLADVIDAVAVKLGDGPHNDYNMLSREIKAEAANQDIKLTAKRLNLIRNVLTEKDESAETVVKKKSKGIIEYEPDTDLRDTEQVPLLEEGGIDGFFEREVLPHVPDAWIDRSKTQIGYEISFTRHFYKPTPMRSLDEIKADLESLQQEAEGLLDKITGTAK